MYIIEKTIIKNDYITLILDSDKIQISIDTYFKHNIKQFKEISDDLYLILKEDEKLLKAYLSCLRKLSVKDYSIKQMRDYLYKKELSNNDINNIIVKLCEYNLLNDDKYCISRINILENNHNSYKQIINKLKQEGIEEDIIDKNLVYDENNELNKINILINKYLNRSSNKSLQARKQYIISNIVSNGFNYNMVRQVIDDINIENDNEIELLNKEYSKIKTKYARKYHDYELKERIINSLLQKGFKYDDIKKIVEV